MHVCFSGILFDYQTYVFLSLFEGANLAELSGKIVSCNCSLIIKKNDEYVLRYVEIRKKVFT